VDDGNDSPNNQIGLIQMLDSSPQICLNGCLCAAQPSALKSQRRGTDLMGKKEEGCCQCAGRFFMKNMHPHMLDLLIVADANGFGGHTAQLLCCLAKLALGGQSSLSLPR
jgi:hypothetical protein